MSTSTLDLIWQAGLFVKAVLLVLLGFSVVTWTIIFEKAYHLAAAAKESNAFLQIFEHGPLTATTEAAARLRVSPLAAMFRAVYADGATRQHEAIRRALSKQQAHELEALRSRITFLATTGSTTPFIGLLGTVWGIMNAFQGIGSTGSASLAVVAPGIAEALITTAMGLAAAIPAVMAYNYFLSRLRRVSVQMEQFAVELTLRLTGGRHEA